MVGRLTPQLFGFSSPSSYICGVASSLTPSARLTHSVQYLIQSLVLSPSFYNLTHAHLLSLSLPLSFSKLSFPVFYWSCNPTPLSFSLSNCQISLLVQATPLYSSQPMTKQTKTPNTHTHRHACTHDACCRLRRRLKAAPCRRNRN